MMSKTIFHRLVLILSIACVGVLTSAALVSHGAAVRPDELGFLMNGWVLAGFDEISFGEGFRSFYMAGFGFISAAAALIGGSIGAQYRLALLANIALVGATAALLARFGFRHLAVSRRMSRSLALLVAMTPAVAANSLFAWSETLNRFLFTALVVLAYEHLVRPRWSTSLAVAIAGSLASITHGRFAVIPALVVLMIVIAWTRARRRLLLISAAGVLVAILSYWLFTRVNLSLRRELYPDTSGKEGRMIDRLLDPAQLAGLTRSAVGQLWYSLATSFGLVGVGVVLNLRSAIFGARNPRNLQWAAPTFTLLAAASVALASALGSVSVVRPDHLVYGRYVETIFPVLSMIGLAGLVSASKFARRTWMASIISIPVCALLLALGAGGDGLRRMTSAGAYFAVPNAIALDWAIKLTKPAGYLSLTVAFTCFATVFFLIAAKKKILFLAALGVVSLACTSFTSFRTIAPHRDYLSQMTLDNALRDRIDGPLRETRVLFDSGGLGRPLYFDYLYLVHPTRIDRADIPWIDRTPYRCVIGTANRIPDAAGWELVARENPKSARGDMERGNVVLWMRAGVDSC